MGLGGFVGGRLATRQSLRGGRRLAFALRVLLQVAYSKVPGCEPRVSCDKFHEVGQTMCRGSLETSQ